jgi:hypothetical protein
MQISLFLATALCGVGVLSSPFVPAQSSSQSLARGNVMSGIDPEVGECVTGKYASENCGAKEDDGERLVCLKQCLRDCGMDPDVQPMQAEEGESEIEQDLREMGNAALSAANAMIGLLDAILKDSYDNNKELPGQ